MKREFWILAWTAGALLAGCDRRSTSVNSNAPAPQSSATAADNGVPQTAPANIDSADAKVASAVTTMPATVSFTVHEGADDRLFEFPRARLRITKEGDKCAAVLYSDDPKTAINPDYTGNSFFLRMKLDVEDPQNLTGVDWRFKALNSDHDETGDGIFLNGTRIHLQPSDILVTFDGGGKSVQVVVAGQFLKFDNNDSNRLPIFVGVRGEFPATVEIK